MAVCAGETEFLTKIGENRGIVMLNWFGERREGANQLVESWCMKIGEYQLILPLFV